MTIEDINPATLRLDLVASTCRSCGTKIRAGQGTVLQLGLPSDRVAAAMLRHAAQTGPHHDWNRTCDACTTDDALTSALTAAGLPADLTAAERRIFRAPYLAREVLDDAMPDTVKENTGTPWSHLTGTPAEILRAELERVYSLTRPTVSPLGACGLCGIRVSIGWEDAPGALKWHDDTRTPMCSTCAAVWSRRGRPISIEGLRAIGVEASSGLTWLGMEAPESFRLYAESRDADGNGNAEPWTYSEKLIEWLDGVWSAKPKLAPADRREHYERKRSDAVAAERAEREKLAAADRW